MLPDHDGGTSSHRLGGRKIGSTRTRQTMKGAGVPISSERYRAIAATNADKLGTPFFIPKASQANWMGSAELLTNVPKPPTLLRGLLIRNANRSPSPIARKLPLLGFQKLTSS